MVDSIHTLYCQHKSVPRGHLAGKGPACMQHKSVRLVRRAGAPNGIRDIGSNPDYSQSNSHESPDSSEATLTGRDKSQNKTGKIGIN
jgi:hypothetical protein